MKYKVLHLIILLLAFQGKTIAQDFIKIKENVLINDHHFYKGELFPKIDSNKFSYGPDTIIVPKNKFEIINNFIDTISNKKTNIFKRLDSSKYLIRVSVFLNGKNTVKFVASDNYIIDFLNNDSADIDTSKLDSITRLIIPDQPSLIFTKDEILNTPFDNIKEDNIEKSFISKFFGSLTWWKYLILGVLLIIIVFVLYRLALYTKLFQAKEPKTAKFLSDSIEGFAYDNNISVEKLIRYNSVLKRYNELNQNERKSLKNKIKNQDLIVGYYKKEKKSQESVQIDNTKPVEWNTSKVKSDDDSNFSKLYNVLQSMETRLSNKINEASSNRESAHKIEILQKETDSLKEKLNQSNKEKERVSNEKSEVQSQLMSVNKEKQKCESELIRFSEKLAFVDFIEPFARVVADYFSYSKSGIAKALELFNKYEASDNKNRLIVSQLLLKFFSSTPMNFGNWEEIISEIKLNKVTTNNDLIKSFRQIQSNEEKLKEFKRIIYEDVLLNYASCILILSEEFSKLSKFVGNSDNITSDFESFFKSYSIELQSKTRAIGLDLNYVPLFENFEKYAALAKLVNHSCSSSYKNILNLEKDSVLEIVSYGFGNSETKVILS